MAQHDMQDLMQGWMEQQRKLWQDWMENAQKLTGGGAAQPWGEGLERWQQAVEETLETQKKATRAWADQIAAVEGAPEETQRWASEGVKLFDQWTDAQHKMWQQWFELMGHTGTGAHDDQLKQMTSGWEQMATQMQELQRQWAGAFTGMAGAVTPKGTGKPGGGKT